MPRVLVRPTRTPTYFGVAWDKDCPEVLNAITIDVLAYNRVVPNTSRLVLVCQDFGFLNPLSSVAGIEITSDPDLRTACEIWKLYYVETCPAIPSNGKHVYQKKVTNFGVNHTELNKGREGYPSLWNASDNVIVPPSLSPNINKIPPRYFPNGYSTPHV